MTKTDIDKLRHDLDHCLLMANKFYETKKPKYYIMNGSILREVLRDAKSS